MARKLALIASCLIVALAALLPLPARAGSPIVFLQEPEGDDSGNSPALLIHAPSFGGIRPTLTLTPASALAGDLVQVHGTAPAPFTAVYITAVLGGRTQYNIRLPVAANRSYSTMLRVPVLTPPGALEVCATVAGAENGALACSVLTINPPPSKRVTGALPAGVTATNAVALLVDSAGNEAYRAPVTGQGAYTFPSVTAGNYTLALAGNLSQLLAGQDLTVSAQDPSNNIAAPQLAPNLLCQFDDPYYIGHVKATPSRVLATSLSASTADAPANEMAIPDASSVPAPAFTAPKTKQPFGIYVSGVTLPVTFQIEPMAKGEVQSLTVSFHNRDGTLVKEVVLKQKPWVVSNFNVGSLGTSSGSKHPYMRVIVQGEPGNCELRRDLQVIDHPYGKTARPGALTWNGTQNRYVIDARFPDAGSLLPQKFPFPPNSMDPIPILGRFNNEFDLGLQIKGWLNLDGIMHLDSADVGLRAYVMSYNLLGKYSKDMIPGSVEMNHLAMKLVALNTGTMQLAHQDVPFADVEVPVLGLPGVITVDAIAGAGMEFDLTGGASLWAGSGVSTLHLDPLAAIYGYVGAQANLLFGLGKAGAKAKFTGSISMPVEVKTPPPVVDTDACLGLNVKVIAFYSVAWGLYKKQTSKTVANWSECVDISTVEQDEELTAPDLLAAPVVAVDPNGRALMAWVENTAAAGAQPAVQILARMRPAGSGTWGPAVALSNPLHTAGDPTAVFAGPDIVPMVAWSEFNLTAEEAAELGDDPVAHMRTKEIALSTFDGNSWNTLFVTNDRLPDGMPSLAGGSAGGVLAWTRDTDGDFETRTDQRIAVNLPFAPAPEPFPIELLSGASDSGLNNEVATAWNGETGQPWLAWTFDADGDLLTPNDRRIAVAEHTADGWTVLNTSALPAHADSPALNFHNGALWLTFLERAATAGGSRSVLGANGMLWVARLAGDGWDATPMVGPEGTPIYGEAPTLARRSFGLVLLFRQWGGSDGFGYLGQLALSQLVGQSFSPPLALTSNPNPSWMGQVAVNPVNDSLLVVKVALDAGQPAAAAADPVEVLEVSPTADPALDALTVSTAAPGPGEPFSVTVPVRNVGLNETGPVTVRLLHGQPGSGVEIGAQSVPGALSMNETRLLTFALTGNGSVQPFYAELSTSGGNLRTDNDMRAVTVNELEPAHMASVAASEQMLWALQIAWAGGESYTAGYRILRAATPTGPWELVGESSLPYFQDAPVPLNTAVCYAVQAYNLTALGTVSAPLCGQLDAHMIWMPVVSR